MLCDSLAGYDAYGLSFRDLTAGVSAGDPTGADLLAGYLAGVRARNPRLPRATVTNLELDDDDPLAPHVARHTLLPLDGGRTAAFLSVTDPTHTTPLNPHYGGKLVSYKQGLVREIALLRRLPPGERPDVIVAVVKEAPFAAETDAGASRADARAAFLEDLVNHAIGLDVVLISETEDSGAEGAHFLTNWAGDRVYIIPDTERFGTSVDRIMLSFDGAGFVVDAARAKVPLTCAVPSHAATAATVAGYLAQMEAVLNTPVGYLAAPADGARIRPSNGTESVSVPSGAEAAAEGRHAGCRVSECTAGNLITDAYRDISGASFGVSNGGEIRNSLSAGAVTEGDINQMLPFVTNDLVVVENVTSAVLWAVLGHAISKLDNADVQADPDGRFLQVSGLRFEWLFTASGEPKVQVVQAEEADGSFMAVAADDDDRMFSIAVCKHVAP